MAARSYWRDTDWGSRGSLLEHTRNYSTGVESVPVVNILLVGNVGAGKSSLCNTVDSVFKGRTSVQAEARPTGGGASVSKQFRRYKPGGRRGQHVAFNFCDTMGMELDDGLAVEDMPYIMDGNIPDGFRLDHGKRITPDDTGFVRLPELSQRIHCVGIVIDGARFSSLSSGEKRKFKEIRDLATSRKISPVVLVTHIDEMSELVQKDVRMAYSLSAVSDLFKKISEMVKVDMSDIFAVKNYSTEIDIDTYTDVLALTALRKMLKSADDMLRKKLCRSK